VEYVRYIRHSPLSTSSINHTSHLVPQPVLSGNFGATPSHQEVQPDEIGLLMVDSAHLKKMFRAFNL
jgi:hypothetical protein